MDDTLWGKAGRGRKELAFVECQASCWLQNESLMCFDTACPDLSLLVVFWPFIETFTKQCIRSIVHSITFNPLNKILLFPISFNLLNKMLLSPFYIGGNRNIGIKPRSYLTTNEWKNLGPTSCSVCSAIPCCSPSPTPSPEITDGIFRPVFCMDGGNALKGTECTLLALCLWTVPLFFLASEKHNIKSDFVIQTHKHIPRRRLLVNKGPITYQRCWPRTYQMSFEAK